MIHAMKNIYKYRMNLLSKILISFMLTIIMAGNVWGQQKKSRVILSDTKDQYTSYYYQQNGVRPELVNEALRDEISLAFPCLRVMNMAKIREMISQEKQRQLLTCNEESVLDIIGAEIGARYMVTSSFGNVGTDSWMISVSIIDQARTSVSSSGYVVMKGNLGNIYIELIKKAVEKLAEKDLCPWTGTITVEENTNQDTIHTGKINEGKKVTETIYKHTDKASTKWDIEVTSKWTPSGKQGKGNCTMSDAYYTATEITSTGDVPCFKNTKPCEITDAILPGDFYHYLTFVQGKINGSRAFDNIEVIISFEPGTDKYTISINSDGPMAIGEGKAEGFESSEYTCGKCILKDTKDPYTGYAWASWNVDGKGKKTDPKLSGKVKIVLADHAEQNISWDLHR